VNRNAETSSSIEVLVGESVRQLAGESPEPMVVSDYTDTTTLHSLREEALRRKRNRLARRVFFSPHGEASGWENIDRATFFTFSNAEDARDKFVAAPFLHSRFWLPQAHRFGRVVSACVQSAAAENGLPMLQDWVPNRVGINLAKGSEANHAVIADHRDVPAEHGLVVALNLIEGGDANRFLPGNLSLIFGFDVCKSLGLEQPFHGVDTSTERISITYADLRPSQA